MRILTRNRVCQDVGGPAKPLLLHVVTVPWTLWAFFAGQIRHMKENGFEVAAVSSEGPQAGFVEQRDDIRVYRVPMQRRISPLADIIALFRLFRIIRRLRPTIVHGHTPKAGFLGMLAACFARAPVRIFTLHGLRGSQIKGIKGKIVEFSERLTCRLAHEVLAVSNSLCQEAIDRGLCSRDRIKVLANGSCNGIDAENRFNPEKYPKEVRTQMRRRYGIPEDALVLCYVGRIVRDKGIVELAEAWLRLRREFENLYLLMVGEFESGDDVGPEVSEVLKSDDRVCVTGFVYDMPEHYSAVDLVILPTYREGFGYTALEAAAMGLPVVATKVVGCVDAVEDGRTGILVPVKDAVALYEAIKGLLSDKSLRERLGQAGRQRALQRFAPDAIWGALHSEYVSLMRKRGVEWLKPDRLEEACYEKG